MKTASYNPRYTIYAKVHKHTEEEQLAFDKERYPGGCMFGFSQWIKDNWKEFCEKFGYCYEMRLCYQEHFDKWLKETYNES